MTLCHPQLQHAEPGSLWVLTCTVAINGDTITFTEVLARRLPDEISDHDGGPLFELLPLGERVLVDVDQIQEATPATLHLDRPAAPAGTRLRIVTP